MEPENQIMIRNALLECASAILPASFFPAKSPEASELITTDPYAFLIAACLDRGTKAEIIWSIPYAIKKRLGVSDFDDDIEAINAARRLNPQFPGELDGPLWWIGRNWCRAKSPHCSNCPVIEVCDKRKYLWHT